MRVKILQYDQIKGRGIASDESGKLINFSYQQFKDERMIPAGSHADFIDNILHPVEELAQSVILVLWNQFKTWLKGVFKWQ